MLFVLLSWLGGAAQAIDGSPSVSIIRVCPPNCLAIKDFDTERHPGDLTEDWDRTLAKTGGLQSVLVKVAAYGADLQIVVNSETLDEDNLVDKVEDEDGLVFYHRVPIGPPDGLFVEITNVGEKDAGYDILIEGTSEAVR